MTQTPAPRQPPATRHAGRRPIPVPPARTYGRKSKSGRNRVPASRRTGNSVSPAPQPGQNRSATVTLSVRQHPMPTGATRSSTRPVSRDSLARLGPTAPPCTTRPNRAPRMPDLSQVVTRPAPVVHDLTARILSIARELAAAGLVALADKGKHRRSGDRVIAPDRRRNKCFAEGCRPGLRRVAALRASAPTPSSGT